MLAALSLLLLGPLTGVALPATFDTPAGWATFDPGANGIGSTADGFGGGTFDGRYVYFAPFWSGNSEVMRYDTYRQFDDPSSWSTHDPGSKGGYAGACFDGRYVYFAPWSDLVVPHGEVLRYDTMGPFDSPSSWSTFDAQANQVGANTVGYWGILCNDDGFVYFSPEFYGEVLRYDTSLPFSDASSWLAFNPDGNGVGNYPEGYKGVVSDGRNLYFVPYWNFSVGSHGEMLAYDTSQPFDSPQSWSAYTPNDHGVGSEGKGFEDAVYDGRYIYFIPSYSGVGSDAYHGEVMRYDTTLPFTSAGSWVAYDPGDTGHVGVDPDGYNGGFFDGRYIYFAPSNHGNPDGPHGEVLRYDTTGGFTAASSWDTFDPGANGVGTDPDGYFGVVFDGSYLYFVPDRHEDQTPHGEVLRFEIVAPVPLMAPWSYLLSVASLIGSGAIAARNSMLRTQSK